MAEFDRIDKEILYLLDRNAKATFTELAKSVRLSKQAVKSRIAQLERFGIIKGYVTKIDESKLGFGEFEIWVHLGEMSAEKRRELVKHLVDLPESYWVASFNLRWDLGFGLHARNVNAFSALWYEIVFPSIAQHVREYQFSILTQFSAFPKKYLLETKKRAEFETTATTLSSSAEILELDKKEKTILVLIDNNPRMHTYEIAAKTGISEKTVRLKIAGLEKKGVITGYKAIIDQRKLGYSKYELFLRLKITGKKEEIEMLGFCQQHPNITMFMKCIGKWDLDIAIETQTIEEFQDVVSSFKNRFADLILDYDFVIGGEDHKFSYYPKRPA